MTNIQLIRAFVSGAVKGKANNMEIDGDRLLSYATSICVRKGGKYYVNVEKYSVTTSRQQTLLRRELLGKDCEDRMGEGFGRGIDYIMER